MDGKLRIKGVPNAEMPLAQAAAVMLARSDLLPPGMDPNPEATYVWTAPGRTVADDQGRAKSYLTAANACHLVLVEVDAETGKVDILRYWIADDCGTRLNPATVDGMIQGGVAQGVGAALLEEYVYDDDGQLLTSTFMDYLLPSVYEVPMTEKTALCTPSPFTPLGAKGGGRERHAHDAGGGHVRHQRRAGAARRAGARGAGQPAPSLEAAQQRTTNEEIIVKTARTDQLSNGKRKATSRSSSRRRRRSRRTSSSPSPSATS
jgi:hypothetical protein